MVHDNFSIYSRINSVDVVYDENKISWEMYASNIYDREITTTNIFVATNKYFIDASTEAMGIRSNLESNLNTNGPIELKSSIISEVILKSKLHPHAVEMIASPLESVILLNRSGMHEFQNLGSYDAKPNEWKLAYVEHFMHSQEKLIKQNLQNCSKSAWLLPLYKAETVATFLRQQNLHSDVGKETYFKTNFALHLVGLVPSHILKGFAAVAEAGLFEWWDNILVSFIDSTDNSDLGPLKPNMKGNILVIFVVWLVGMAYSFVIFIGEFW